MVSGMQAAIRDQVSHIGSSRFQTGRLLSGKLFGRPPTRSFERSDTEISNDNGPSRAKHQRRRAVNLSLSIVSQSARWRYGLLVVLLFATVNDLNASAAGLGPLPNEVELPRDFWVGKSHVQRRLDEEQAVLVSVRTEAGRVDKQADRLVMSGVGWVKRPPNEVYGRAQDFERLKVISDHFREVKYEPQSRRLFILSQALGYQARMLFQLRFDIERKRIFFQVIDGHFLGLHGVIEMATVAKRSQVTELSVLMAHEARELPIPRILIGFALEVIAKNVALKMRRYLEEPRVGL